MTSRSRSVELQFLTDKVSQKLQTRGNDAGKQPKASTVKYARSSSAIKREPAGKTTRISAAGSRLSTSRFNYRNRDGLYQSPEIERKNTPVPVSVGQQGFRWAPSVEATSMLAEKNEADQPTEQPKKGEQPKEAKEVSPLRRSIRKSRHLILQQKPLIAVESEVDDLLKTALRTRASVAQTSGDELLCIGPTFEVVLTDPAQIMSVHEITDRVSVEQDLPGASCRVEIFTKGKGLTPSFTPLAPILKLKSWEKRSAKLSGRKIRLAYQINETANIPLSMRGVPIKVLRQFHKEFPGLDAQSKLEGLLAACPKHLSYVQWKCSESAIAETGFRYTCGLPVVVVSCPDIGLNFEQMVDFLEQELGADTRVWLSQLACNQHALQSGDMTELDDLPHVIGFVGQVAVMPGATTSLACLFYCGLSLQCNGQFEYCEAMAIDSQYKKLKAVNEDDTEEIQESLYGNLHELVEEDKNSFILPDTELIEQSHSFDTVDEYFYSLIEPAFGSKDTLVEELRHYLTQCGMLTAKRKLTLQRMDPDELQREALKLIFLQTDGKCWTSKSGWLTDAPLSTWEGVRTDSKGRVTGLQLSEIGLRGELPDCFHYLSSLQAIDFSVNGLIGEIPQSFKTLPNLVYLNIRANQFSGKIPEIFGAMSHLVEFLADYNELVGSVPRSLKECKQLEKIYLNGNKGMRKPALAPQAQHFAGGIFYEDKHNTQAFLKSIGALF